MRITLGASDLDFQWLSEILQRLGGLIFWIRPWNKCLDCFFLCSWKSNESIFNWNIYCKNKWLWIHESECHCPAFCQWLAKWIYGVDHRPEELPNLSYWHNLYINKISSTQQLIVYNFQTYIVQISVYKFYSGLGVIVCTREVLGLIMGIIAIILIEHIW